MKREIKFRVWDHNTDTMMIPDNFEFYDGKIGWIDAGREAGPESGNDGYPDQFDLMQYTGLHDKNGKEVYENDILKCDRPAYHQNPKFVVKDWVLGKLILRDVPVKGFGTSFWSNGNDVEVIGNIYENPDLLEAQHD